MRDLEIIGEIQKDKLFIFFHLWNLDLKFYCVGACEP